MKLFWGGGQVASNASVSVECRTFVLFVHVDDLEPQSHETPSPQSDRRSTRRSQEVVRIDYPSPLRLGVVMFAISRWLVSGIAAAVVMCSLATAATSHECKNRGQLDELYCDEDNDLVADAPSDLKKLRDPATLTFTYTPVENPTVYQSVFRPLVDFLAQCSGKPFAYQLVQSNSAEIAAMRAGDLHVAGFSTGPTVLAVNSAGAIPFAAKGTAQGPQGYHLLSIVKKDSPYQRIVELKGKRIAHTSPSSNSGHLAPLVLYPSEGLKPYEDYEPLMSGGHDKSVLGVASGEYDMAGVASDVFERMHTRGTVSKDDFRVIFTSPVFPTSSFAYAHDLRPELARKIRACFFAFDFPPPMRKEFNGADRFFPITYKETWKVVRDITGVGGNLQRSP